MKIGVIVARMQVPFLHAGHIHLVNEVWKRSDRILIILGTPTKPDDRNILPFELRKEMIIESYPFAYIEEIKDHREDKDWSGHLDKIMDYYIKNGEGEDKDEIMLYGSRDCFHRFYKGKYSFTEIEELRHFSGTKMRENMKIVNNAYYRMGLINGFNLAKNE